MLLIYPPIAKPSEPPAGIAKLAGALETHRLSYRVLDANLEGLLFLLNEAGTPSDTWSRRAVKNASRNIVALRDPKTYVSPDRYARAVSDLNRVLEISGSERDVIAGLADYQDQKLSPVRSSDLLHAAEYPEKNIFYPYFTKRIPEVIDENVTGISLNYLSQALTTFAMIGFIRKEFPQVKIVLGGGLITSWMKRPGWRNPFAGLVEHLVAGPGERPLLSLLGVKDIQDNHYRPDYQSLPLHDYLSPGFVLPYSASSGCYWNKCSFCPEKAEESSYVPVPVGLAISDLEHLTEKTKPVLIHLLDNAVSPAFLHAFAESPRIPWYGFARIGRELSDLDFCLALKQSGCAMLKLGLESGDQEVLDKMQKGIDLETASRVLKNLKKAEIMTYVYLLFGAPEETTAGAGKTLDFVVRHRDAITFLNLAIFNMPLSVCADGYSTDQFYEGDLSLYTGFSHPYGWDRKKVRRFLENEFKRDPSISQILKHDPPVFTSNHAAFFDSKFF